MIEMYIKGLLVKEAQDDDHLAGAISLDNINLGFSDTVLSVNIPTVFNPEVTVAPKVEPKPKKGSVAEKRLRKSEARKR